jgi:predicted permease
MTAPSRFAHSRRLVPAFFARFFESELTDGADDPKTAFFALVAILAVPGFVLPLLLAGASAPIPAATGLGIDPSGWGWSMIAHYQGVDALRTISRADKAFYLGFAVIASAIVSVIVWNVLLLDRRDRLVLGPLPVRQTTLAAAKLIAVAMYVIAVAVAMHALASLAFGIALAANNTLTFALRGIAAHFIASMAASAFVMFAVVAVQGVALAALGPRWFVRISPVLQLCLVCSIVIGVVTVPAMSQAVAGILDGTAANRRVWAFAPPLWFLGLYERVLGTSDATLLAFAKTAVMAIAASAGTAVCAFALACRRVPIAAAAVPAVRLRWSALAIGAAVRLMTRDPRLRAAAQFFLTTIARSHRHRLVLASAMGVAAAWGLPAWIALFGGAREVDVTLLSSGLAVPLFLLLGLRVAAWMPADLRAAWAFEMPSLPWQTTRAVMERTMLLIAVLPSILIFAVLYGWLWGLQAALLHVLLLLSVAILLVQALLWRFEGVPCTRPWSRDVLRLQNAWPAYVAVVLTLSRGLPGFEKLVLSRPIMCSGVALYMLTLAYRIRVASRAAASTEEPVDVLASALRAAAWTKAGAGPAAESATITDAASPPSFLGSLPRDRDLQADDFAVRDVLAMLRPSRVVRDVRLAFRRLAAAPLFTLFSIATLGCGVGITTGVYSVVHAALWTPPPVPDIDRIVDVDASNGRSRAAFSWPDFADFASRQRVFTRLAASTMFRLPLVAGEVGEVVYGEAVNGSYFSALGIRPAAGRLIQESDNQPGAAPVAVLSYPIWRLRFQGDPSVVGRTVRLDDRVYDVVGVAPSGFRGWDFSNLAHLPAVWVPLAAAPEEVTARMRRNDRLFAWLVVKGRLAEGQTIEQASAQLATIGRGLEAEYPTPGSMGEGSSSRFGRRWYATSSRAQDRVGIGLTARLFVCAVAMVLLIGCTNLANLAIARGASREHELAVRRALGASRVDLVREQLAETMLVAAASGFLAAVIIRTVTTALALEVPAGAGQFIVIEPRLNVPVLLFAAAAGLCALVTFGIWPAFHLTRTPARAGLVTGVAATPPHWRLHRRLIGWQVGASVTLLLLAAACVNAIVVHALHDTGVDVDRLAIVSVDFETNRYDEARTRAAVADIVAAASHQPGLVSAAASTELPFGSGLTGEWSASTAEEPVDRAETIQVVPATPDILRTLGVRLLHGRALAAQDTVSGFRAVVVSESFAVRRWGTANVIGRTLRLSGRTSNRATRRSGDSLLTIVGVAADTDAGRTGSREHGVAYVPLEQHAARRAITFTVRTEGDSRAALVALRTALRQVDPNLVVDRAATGMFYLAGQYVVLGFVAAVVTTLGAVALLLAMSGLFGVVSHLVSRRTRELAVRIALGAERSRIVRLVLADGLRPVLDGLALGLFAGAVCRAIVAATISSAVAAVDPIAFVIVPLLFMVTALGACYWPARRASRVDPNVALRES